MEVPSSSSKVRISTRIEEARPPNKQFYLDYVYHLSVYQSVPIMKSTGVLTFVAVVGWLVDPIYGWIEIPTTIRSNLHQRGKIALSPINIKDDYSYIIYTHCGEDLLLFK